MNKEVKNVGDPCGCPTVCYKPGGLKCAITGEVNQIQKFHEGVPVDRTISHVDSYAENAVPYSMKAKKSA